MDLLKTRVIVALQELSYRMQQLQMKTANPCLFQTRKECKAVKEKKGKIVEEKKELMKLLSTSQVPAFSRLILRRNFYFI